MNSPDWKPTITDMHKAFAAWRAREKPSIWHPLWVDPNKHMVLPLPSPGTTVGFPFDAVPPLQSAIYTMDVYLIATRVADRLFGCIVGATMVLAPRSPNQTIKTVLDGPFRIDGTYVAPPRHSDEELWVPPDTLRHEYPSQGGIGVVLVDPEGFTVRGGACPHCPENSVFLTCKGWRS